MSVHANELWNNYMWADECMHSTPIRHLGYALIRHVGCTLVAPLGYTEASFRLCCLDKCKHTNKWNVPYMGNRTWIWVLALARCMGHALVWLCLISVSPWTFQFQEAQVQNIGQVGCLPPFHLYVCPNLLAVETCPVSVYCETDSASGKLHLSFCTLLHLNTFLLRHDKIKNFMIKFSALFLLIWCRKVSYVFYVFMH
jgi:hypothetical protein